MHEKETKELENILIHTHLSEFESYIDDNQDSIMSESTSFFTYVKTLFAQKGKTQSEVFLKADIPERYGYKLLSGQKHTKQRDIILRICYAAEFTLPETQRSLRKYGMPELYAKEKRDALIMIAFNDRPGSIIDLNSMLNKYGMAPLKTSGIQE